MTRSVSAAAWRPPAKRPAFGRAAKVAALLLAAIGLTQYIAGFVFLRWTGEATREASPLTIARYAYYYGHDARVRQRLFTSTGIASSVLLLSGLAVLWPRRRTLHGDARFATVAEIRAAGLFSDHGIILGRIGKRLLILGGQQGVALAAPPRAGKGIGVVIPNLLTWPGSVVCIDIKKENWTITAGFRERCGQACYLFDPFAEDGRSARWNPFSYVSSDAQRRVNDLQRIGEMLYPDPANVDPFWTASARSLFLGIALYLFETPTLTKTIGEVLRQGMASDDEGFGHHWKRIIEGRNRGPYPLSPQCIRSLYDVIDLAPVTASSIRKTFTSRLDLWLNPILDAATSASDFDLRDLRKRPMSIYVGVNPDDLHRLRPVLNLFFQQTLGLQTRELPELNPALQYQVLMMLDEFTAVGRIQIMAEAISFLPGYNVRVMLVIHTPAQLREIYGIHNAETMLKSLAARIVFAPKDFPDAREISDELGFTTVKAKSVSTPLMSFSDSAGRRSRSQSVSDQRRALLLPQEVKELGNEQALIFYEGLRPIRCRKIRYFSDARFRARLFDPPAHPVPPSAVDPKTLESRTPERNTVGVLAGSGPIAVDLPPPPPRRSQESDMPTREATLEDIDRLDSLTAQDFACDLSKVEIPEHDGRMSDAEMSAAVSSFFDSLRLP